MRAPFSTVPPAAERIAAGIALSAMHGIIEQLAAIVHERNDPQENVDSSAQAEIRTTTYTSRTIKKTASGHGDLKIDKNGVAAPRAVTHSVHELRELLASKGGLRTQFYCSASSTDSLREITDRTIEIARELCIPQDRWFEAISRLGLRDAVTLLCNIDRRSPTENAPVPNPIRCPTAFLTHHLRQKYGLQQMRPRQFGATGTQMIASQRVVDRSELRSRISHAGQ